MVEITAEYLKKLIDEEGIDLFSEALEKINDESMLLEKVVMKTYFTETTKSLIEYALMHGKDAIAVKLLEYRAVQEMADEHNNHLLRKAITMKCVEAVKSLVALENVQKGLEQFLKTLSEGVDPEMMKLVQDVVDEKAWLLLEDEKSEPKVVSP